jgi:cell division septation protein DedD
MAVALAAILILAVLGPTAAAPQAARLDQVDALIAEAAYDDARSALLAWWSANESANVPGAERARALMLRARIAPDHAAAEPDYLSIVLGYPTSSHAPLALLRLGQGLLAAGESERAAGYLQRLVADYPGRPERSVGLLWLVRAHSANRQDGAACATARQALRDTNDADLLDMLRTEESIACAAAGSRAAQAVPQATPPRAAQPQAAPTQAAATQARVTTGRFSAQTGAFRQQASVDDMVARLRRAGYEPRVVRVPANDLIRVRVGQFASRDEAARLVARLNGDGFDALVTGDSDQEREP